MTRIARAVWRLLSLQASWTYERMQGIGIGYASLPLLEPLARSPERHREAVARAAEYFNAHPYLAGIAVGAVARAEADGVPGATIRRLKTALAGPLGSLGDQLFWIGVVPLVLGLMLAAVAWGGGIAVVGVGVAGYLVVRCLVTVWGIRLGAAAGLGVAQALKASGLAELVLRVGLAAGFVVAAAVPPVVRWLLPGAELGAGAVAAAAGAAGGTVAALVRFRVWTARRLTLLAMAIVVLFWWSVR